MRTRIIGGLATFPRRAKLLPDVVGSLAPQFSVLYVYLNGYKKIPSFFSAYDNIVPVLGKDAFGDISANGKMYFLLHENEGTAFTLDDDFIYPDNYVEEFMNYFDQVGGNVCLGVHASVFPDAPNYYYERQAVFGAESFLSNCHIVNLIGSGTSAFPVTLYKNIDFKFSDDVYVDLHISLTALKNEVPMITLARPENWLHAMATKGLWSKNRKKVTHHTHIVRQNREYLCWDYLRALWKNAFESMNLSLEQGACRFHLAPPNLDFLMGQDYLANHSALLQIKKLKEFADNLNKQG